MDSNGPVVATGFGWDNVMSLGFTIGAYYAGVYIQHQYRRDRHHRRDRHQVSSGASTERLLMPLRIQLLLRLIPCAVVVSAMGPIVACTLADWTLFYSLALIGEQGFLVNKFFVTRLTTRSA